MRRIFAWNCAAAPRRRYEFDFDDGDVQWSETNTLNYPGSFEVAATHTKPARFRSRLVAGTSWKDY